MNSYNSFKSMLLAGTLLLSAGSAFGWGQKGHDVTAAIAEKHLTKAAQDSVKKILKGKSLVYYANWPDNAAHTDEYAFSKTWHYKNIDADQTYESAPNIPEGNIISAINQQAAILDNPRSTEHEKWLALVFVTHFMGDLHQPMHMGRAVDRGGNNHKIKYFGGDTNLHSIWDSKLVESAHKWGYTEWVEQIDRAGCAERCAILAQGNPDKWGKETYEIAKQVYEQTPEGTNVGFDYIAEWTPVIENQFLRGGLRLADLLNSIFDPEYVQKNTVIAPKNTKPGCCDGTEASAVPLEADK